MTWNKFKTFFFQSLLGHVHNRKLKDWQSHNFLKGTLSLPSECHVAALRRPVPCERPLSPPRPGKHLLITEVTSVWTFHSFRIHGTDWMHVFLNIYILTEGPGMITNMSNSPQHRTRLPTTQFKFNSQLPMNFNPGGEQVKTSERSHYLTRFWKDGKTRVPNWSRWVLPRTGHVTLFLACPWVRGHQGI